MRSLTVIISVLAIMLTAGASEILPAVNSVKLGHAVVCQSECIKLTVVSFGTYQNRSCEEFSAKLLTSESTTLLTIVKLSNDQCQKEKSQPEFKQVRIELPYTPISKTVLLANPLLLRL